MTRTIHKTRLEADSTTAGDVPASVDLPAGYLDGNYVTVPALRKRFPRKRVIALTVNGSTPHADGIDCEAGDATPGTAARYVRDEHDHGHTSTIYTPLAELGAVCDALRLQGLGLRQPIWTAHYTGHAHLCDQACFDELHLRLPFKPLIVATQYADPAHGAGGHFDLSLVADYWPGVDPPPPARKTRLSPVSRMLARHLTRRLARRHTPLASGVDVLTALDAQIKRVKGLK